MIIMFPGLPLGRPFKNSYIFNVVTAMALSDGHRSLTGPTLLYRAAATSVCGSQTTTSFHRLKNADIHLFKIFIII